MSRIDDCITKLVTLTSKFYCSFEASLPGTTQDHLQIFNIEMKAKMKSYQMPEQVKFVLSFVKISPYIFALLFSLEQNCCCLLIRLSFGSGLRPSYWAW